MADHLHIVQTEEEKKQQTVLAHLWHQLGDEKLVIQEAAQAIFIGNESLLSNLTFLLHHLMQNPECVAKLRAEMDSLSLGLVGHRVWHDPRVLQLPYLVRIFPGFISGATLTLLDQGCPLQRVNTA